MSRNTGRCRACGTYVLSLLAFIGILLPTAVDASGSYTYDPVGRLATALYDNGACVAYNYDAAGNRTAQTITAAAGAPQTPNWGTGTWGCFLWTAE